MISSVYGLGLFVESDYVSLSPSFHVERGFLIDKVTGARHRLNYLAEASLRKLSKGVIFHRWVIFMLDEQLSTSEITEIILFVNDVGGFYVDSCRRARAKLYFQRIKNRLLGFSCTVGVRNEPTLAGLINAIWSPSQLLLISSGATALLLLASNLIAPTQVLTGLLSFNLLVSTSLFMHEYFHMWCAKRNKVGSVIFHKGLRLGIIHKPLADKQELISSVGGVASGILSVWALAGVLSILLEPSIPVLIASVITTGHVFSLIPIYGDGRSLDRLRLKRGRA